MIIRDTLHSTVVDGDKLIFNHIHDASGALAQANKFRQNNDGNWTDNRDMRLIGSIDPLAYHKLMKEHPDVAKDPQLLKKWLYETEEGKPWRTNTALLTGKSAQCIVK